MIIRGNTVGNLSPRADWGQNDPLQADFIRGREPVTAALEQAAQHRENRENPHGVTAGQIGAAAADHTHTPADVGAVTEQRVMELIQTELGVIEHGTY